MKVALIHYWLVGMRGGEKMLEALCEIDPKASSKLANSLKYIPQIMSLKDLIDSVDIVIEAASLKVVPELLQLAIEKEKDILILSVGGLFGQEAMMEKADRKGIKIYIPSGAIGGMDAVKASHIGGIQNVSLETIKPPLSYEGAPYLKEHKIALSQIKEKTIKLIFRVF